MASTRRNQQIITAAVQLDDEWARDYLDTTDDYETWLARRLDQDFHLVLPGSIGSTVHFAGVRFADDEQALIRAIRAELDASPALGELSTNRIISAGRARLEQATAPR